MFVEKTIKPWGYERLLAKNDYYALKEIVVNAGNRISLQRHICKTESWYITDGHGIATMHVESNQFRVNVGDTVDIDKGILHRLCAGCDGITFIEVSTPELDDVVRIADDYGRDG